MSVAIDTVTGRPFTQHTLSPMFYHISITLCNHFLTTPFRSTIFICEINRIQVEMNEDDDPENGEKLQVDRKRLEAMITGMVINIISYRSLPNPGQPVYGTDIVLPNAVDFFDKVESLSGATILWPNQLKIGAKTKKVQYFRKSLM